MRARIDLRSHVAGGPQITQVEPTPPLGFQTPVNGQYLIPFPDGIELTINTDSYVLDGGGGLDGGDITSMAFAQLLAMFPMYGNIYFNPLLTDEHVGELDLTALFKNVNLPAPHGPSPPNPPVYFPTRAVTGRGPLNPPAQPYAAGQMPTHTHLLPVNDTMVDPPESLPERPGMLITTDIDISALEPAGVTDFMVYWKLLNFEVSNDVSSTYGANAGDNKPAERTVEETDQEPGGFTVYISADGGANWSELDLMVPFIFGAPTTVFRLAFENYSNSRIYIANFAVLF